MTKPELIEILSYEESSATIGEILDGEETEVFELYLERELRHHDHYKDNLKELTVDQVRAMLEDV